MTTTRTIAAANRPVTINVPTIEPRILPSRFMFSILPTEEAIDTKTIGTTMVNIRFRKICPMGSSAVAFSPMTTPISAPTKIPKSRVNENL